MMNVNAALKAIYATQKQLDEDAHYSLKEYVENTHRHVHEMETTYGFTLHYGERVGGYIGAALIGMLVSFLFLA